MLAPLTTVAALCTAAWSSGEHPRILFTADELPQLRARATAAGSLNAELLARAKSVHASVGPLAVSTDAAASVQNLAIIHALDDDADDTYGKHALDVVHHWVTVYEPNTGYPEGDVWFPHFAFVAMALVYDLCFDLRTTPGYDVKLDDIRDELYRVGNVNQWRLPDMDRHPDNHHVASVTTLGLAALAIEGDVADPQITRWIAMAENFMLNHVDTTWTGGPYRGGPAYGGWTSVLMLELVEALRQRHGLDFSRHPYLVAHSEYLAFSLLPNRSVLGDQRYDHLALNDAYTDRHTHFDLTRDGRFLFWLMERYADDVMLADRVAYLWHHIHGERGRGSDAGVRDLAYAAMWYRDRPLAAPALPRSQTFRNRGLTIGRRHWPSATADVLDVDDVHYSFVSGTFGGFEHRHSDSNSVTLTAFGDRILLDGGGFFLDGAQNASHHTAVTIDGDDLLDGPQGLGDLSVLRVAVNGAWADLAWGDATGGYTPYDGWWGTTPSRVAPQVADRLFAAIPADGDTLLLLIADELQVDDGADHQFRYHYATPSTTLVDLGGSQAFSLTGAHGGRTVDVNLVGEDADLAISTFSGGPGVTYQRVTASQSGTRGWQLTLVTPRSLTGESASIERHETPDVLAARVDHGTDVDTVAVRRAGTADIDALAIMTDARAAGVRQDAAGEVIGLWLIDGSYLDADGVRLFETVAGRLSVVAGPSEVVVEGDAHAFSVWSASASRVRTRQLVLSHRRESAYLFVEASGAIDRARGVDVALWQEDFATPAASFFQETGPLAFGVAPVGVQYRDGMMRLEPFAATTSVSVNRSQPLMGLSEYAGHRDFFEEPQTHLDDGALEAVVQIPSAAFAAGVAAQLRFRQSATAYACYAHAFACGGCAGGCGSVVTAESFLALELDPHGSVRLRRGIDVAPDDPGELLAEASHSFAADTPIALRVEMVGDAVYVSLDGAGVLSHVQEPPLAPARGTVGWRLSPNVGAQLWVDSMSASLFDTTAPLPPLRLRAWPSDRSITVEWTPYGMPPADFSETRVYEVLRPDGPRRLIARVSNPAIRRVVHEGLAPESIHSYVVRIVDSGGRLSASSPVVTSKTLAEGKIPPMHDDPRIGEFTHALLSTIEPADDGDERFPSDDRHNPLLSRGCRAASATSGGLVPFAIGWAALTLARVLRNSRRSRPARVFRVRDGGTHQQEQLPSGSIAQS